MGGLVEAKQAKQTPSAVSCCFQQQGRATDSGPLVGFHEPIPPRLGSVETTEEELIKIKATELCTIQRNRPNVD